MSPYRAMAITLRAMSAVVGAYLLGSLLIALGGGVVVVTVLVVAVAGGLLGFFYDHDRRA